MARLDTNELAVDASELNSDDSSPVGAVADCTRSLMRWLPLTTIQNDLPVTISNE
jgi:hypothetical protein